MPGQASALFHIVVAALLQVLFPFTRQGNSLGELKSQRITAGPVVSFKPACASLSGLPLFWNFYASLRSPISVKSLPILAPGVTAVNKAKSVGCSCGRQTGDR